MIERDGDRLDVGNGDDRPAWAPDPGPARVERLAGIVGAVARQALIDRGARVVALIDDGGPEAGLAAGWLARALPAHAVERIASPGPELEPLLQTAGAEADRSEIRIEALRLTARLVSGGLVANPVNRTVMLLSGAPPPDAFLPLADLPASQVEEIAGAWSGPERVRELADRAGGIRPLDAALHALLDRRDPDGLSRLPLDVRGAVRAALDQGRAARRSPWLVPKIGYRTLGVDLFE